MLILGFIYGFCVKGKTLHLQKLLFDGLTTQKPSNKSFCSRDVLPSTGCQW